MDSIIFDIDNDNESTFRYLQRLKEMYWTKKLGYYPTKIVKVIRKLSREEADRQKEQEDLEFELFIKSIQ